MLRIVFDLDGTLVDSAPDICEVGSKVLATRGAGPLTLAETRSFIGEGAAVFVSRMIEARQLDPSPGYHETLLRDFVAGYEFALDRTAFYPGALAALRQFRAAGHRLGLCTNKPERPARALLAHLGIDSLFGAIVAGGMLPQRKPAPDMLQHALRQLGEGPCLYVGDSEIDAETARRAQVPFALFTGGYRKRDAGDIHHDWLFDHFEELRAIVARLEA